MVRDVCGRDGKLVDKLRMLQLRDPMAFRAVMILVDRLVDKKIN